MPKTPPGLPRRVTTAVVCAFVLGVVGIGSGGTAGADQPDARRFIVVLRDSVSDPGAVAREHSTRYDASVDFVYRHALKGYAATFRGTGASEVAADSRVAYVEPDGVVTASTTQSGATWGLDRIDQRGPQPSATYSYVNTGAGVTAYVIDTGIRANHSDFGGRVTGGYDVVDGSLPADDCNGHGTHVAATVGGTAYGVAKGVSLVPVRVLNCEGGGTSSGVIAGIDFVTGDSSKPGPAVANMSLGGSASTAIDNAVRRSIAAGVTYAVAAGNGNRVGVGQDACKYSPARVTEAITIGATTQSDAKAGFSNHGNCVDWFSPGVDITSAWHTSEIATRTISGTSMATPHTAGVAALYLQSNPSAPPEAVRGALYTRTTKGVVTSSKTANNHLLFTDL